MQHFLKAWPEHFDMLRSGQMPFTIRKNDRLYQKGDTVVFCKWTQNPPGSSTVGYCWQDTENIVFEVTMVLSGWGLQPDHVCLALAPLHVPKAAA